MEQIRQIIEAIDPNVAGTFGIGAMIVVEVVRGLFVRFGLNFKGLPLSLLSIFSLFFAYLIIPGELGWKHQTAGIIAIAVSIAAAATGLRSWGKSIATKVTKTEETTLDDLQKQFDQIKS